ncbi:chemotaxis protein CheB [Pseudooceanicola sp. 200-1SW]|uniref:chemotaxis protein CheB n=1 Tax=Pseudooceanicola sp. 200-1SW TaxID=3425949 RepID=UPI003D7F5F7B
MDCVDGQKRRGPVPVIAIGASAGGVDPVERFVEAAPTDAGWCCVVLAQRADRDGGAMRQALARRSDMPVRLMADGMAPLADTILIVPPETRAEWRDGLFRLTALGADQAAGFPLIDTFLTSLARPGAGPAAAVILSGSGRDGLRGARALRAAGRPVLVQDPQEALFAAMPRAVLEAGAADAALPVAALPGALGAALQGGPGATDGADAAPPVGAGALLDLLERRAGIDLAAYRLSPLRSALAQAGQRQGHGDAEAWQAALGADPEAQDALLAELMAQPAEGFAIAPPVLRVLRRAVLDPLVARRGPRATLRVWVPGCGSGAEAYRIAMELSEALRRAGLRRKFRVIATDVQPAAIERASAGLFAASEVQGLPQRLRQRYLRAEAGQFLIAPGLRQSLIFAGHDVLRDPPYLNLDLISCRHLLGGLRPAAQARVLSMFLYGLRPGGALMLGTGEAGGADRAPGLHPIRPGLSLYRVPPAAAALTPGPGAGAGEDSVGARLIRSYEALMRRYAPSALLLRSNGDVLAWYGEAAALVRAGDRARGRPLEQVLPADLARHLREGIAQMRQEGQGLGAQDLRLVLEVGKVSLRLEWLATGSPDQALILVAVGARQGGQTAKPEVAGRAPAPVASATPAARGGDGMLALSKDTLGLVLGRLEVRGIDPAPANAPPSLAPLAPASPPPPEGSSPEGRTKPLQMMPVAAQSADKLALLAGLDEDMERILEFMLTGALVLDAGLRVLRISALMRRRFGLSDRVLGCALADLGLCLDGAPVEDLARAVLRQGRPLRSLGAVSRGPGATPLPPPGGGDLTELRGQLIGPEAGQGAPPDAEAVALVLTFAGIGPGAPGPGA